MLSQIISASLNTIIHCAWLSIFSQNCHLMFNGLAFVFAIASVCAWSMHKDLATVNYTIKNTISEKLDF